MENIEACIRTVCIFGGSFNPPHAGHVCAAKSFYHASKPDLFIVVPSFVAPHKEIQEIGVHHRFEMAKLAFKEIGAKVEISDMEISRGGKSYTFLTVTEIAEKYPGCKICLFVGSDMLMGFESWYKAKELFSMCRLYVMPRYNDREELIKKADEYRKTYNADITFIDGKLYEMSSTELRAAVKEGREDYLAKHLCRDVYGYIKQYNLYGKE